MVRLHQCARYGEPFVVKYTRQPGGMYLMTGLLKTSWEKAGAAEACAITKNTTLETDQIIFGPEIVCPWCGNGTFKVCGNCWIMTCCSISTWVEFVCHCRYRLPINQFVRETTFEVFEPGQGQTPPKSGMQPKSAASSTSVVPPARTALKLTNGK
jgi:hypothetical protein